MADIKLDGLTLASTANSKAVLDSDVVFPAGHIIQIVQTVKNDTFVGANNTNEQLITGYNCEITPHKSGSKILIHYAFDTSASQTITARSYIERDIASGGYSKLTGAMGNDPGGSAGDPALSHAGTTHNWLSLRRAGIYLDSPTYSFGNKITYRIGVQSELTNTPIYVGTTQRDNSQYHPRTASILILMEVSQ
ncbi:MAG: hypothetical protein CBC12_10730 [Candidatus Puniceispirillum sp. TMED52]|nr:MAG: hypothetical protein CBC12_10730 [Candidatus Puniceispirillum sp. TMED52]